MKELVIKEYLGNSIEFKMINGHVYANATSVARAFENGLQKLADWKRSSKTKELICELNEINGMENSHSLIISESGANTDNCTWIQENLLLDFAQYLSVKFKVWCQQQITILLREGTVSLKTQTEEEMLLQLFPHSEPALIQLTAENIRAAKQLTLENKTLTINLEKQTDETERKVKAIEVLTGKYDVKILQLIAIDYINFQVKRTGRSHQDCWSTIYKLVANSLEIDLEAQLNSFKQKQKNIVKNNQQLNRQYQLKGIDAKRPNTLEDSLFGVTKLSFICSVLNRADVLLEVMAKVFETDLAELIQKYQFIEQEQRLSQQDL